MVFGFQFRWISDLNFSGFCWWFLDSNFVDYGFYFRCFLAFDGGCGGVSVVAAVCGGGG